MMAPAQHTGLEKPFHPGGFASPTHAAGLFCYSENVRRESEGLQGDFGQTFAWHLHNKRFQTTLR